MLMVIFGAGASFDSYSSIPAIKGDQPSRPPLAAELFSGRARFNNILRNYPACQVIIPYLRKAGVAVEEELSLLQSQADKHPDRHKQLAAVRYYLQEIISDCELEWKNVTYGVSNYRTFIDQIVDWTAPEEQVCLVTFNYDLMLEDAMKTFGISINGLPDYISDRKFKLIKLHGSTNWARPLAGRWDGIAQLSGFDVVNAVIGRADRLEFTGTFVITNQHPAQKDGTRPLLPAIAVPVQSKSEFECPYDHLDVLKKCIPRVDKLMAIGWRGAEDRFKELLAKGISDTVPIQIVAEKLDAAVETLTQLGNSGVKTRDSLYGHGFTEFVAGREARDFLHD